MPRTRAKRRVRKSRRLTLRNRTKNKRGGLKTCYRNGEVSKSYEANLWCDRGDTTYPMWDSS